MAELILTGLFVVCAALIVYHHIGYPLLLKKLAEKQPQQETGAAQRGYRSHQTDSGLPSVTILVPAYNEARWIADKIRNLACLDYPSDKLVIRIVCDGCSDNTADIARDTIQEATCADTHFEVREYQQNRGKVAVINQEMKEIRSELTAMSDVSALISVDALLIAAEHFEDVHTGVVNATYQLLDQSNAGESGYWRYQSQLKQSETSLGSSLGSHGAFYLFRTHLFRPLAANTINDDFILPMNIVRQGYRADYDTSMVALEQEPTPPQADFRRRLRISAGNMQQAIELAALFLPRYKGVAFAFISGKGLRLATPYLMLLCLGTSLALAWLPVFALMLGLQVAVYALGLAGWRWPDRFNHKICRWLSYLLVGHTANLLGGLRYLLGMESQRWTKVSR